MRPASRDDHIWINEMPSKSHKQWFLELIGKIRNDNDDLSSEALSNAASILADAGYDNSKHNDLLRFVVRVIAGALTEYRPAGKRTFPYPNQEFLQIASTTLQSMRVEKTKTNLVLQMTRTCPALRRYRDHLDALRMKLTRTVSSADDVPENLASMFKRRRRDEQ